MNVGSQATEYYNRNLERFKRSTGRHTRIFESLKQIVKPWMRVLDVGCGTGITTRFLANHAGYVVGIDSASELVEYARSQSDTIGYVNADFLRTAFAGEFDMVCFIDVLEHSENPEAFVSKAQTYLSENGIVYLNIPHGEYISYLREVNPSILQPIDAAIRLSDLLRWFEDEGLFLVHSSVYGLGIPAQYFEGVFYTKRLLWTTFKGDRYHEEKE